MRTWFPALVLLFLVACAAPPPMPTTNNHQPTTLNHPTPTLTSTPIPTATLIPTPTPTPLPHPAAFDEAFARGLIRYDPENGQWLVSAHQTVDSGRETVELILLPDTFDTHDDLRAKNPLAPYTVRALDENGQEFTLIWNEKTAEFRLAYQFPTLLEGIGTENPKMIAENLDAIPFIPIEDIQNGLAAQSVLLAMQEDGYQPFSEEVIKWYKELGGSSLLFVQNSDGSKIVWLKPKANDKGLKNNFFNSAEIFTPYWFRTKIGEQIYDIAAVAWFDPLDAQNPKTDEFKILFGIPFTTYPMSAAEMTRAYATRHTLLPMWFQIYGENLSPDNPKQSLLAQLLSIKGNDASLDDFWNHDINVRINQLSPTNAIMEVPLYTPGIPYQVPPSMQTDVVLFEVGVAQ